MAEAPFIIVGCDLTQLTPKAAVMPGQVAAAITRLDVLEVQTRAGDKIGVLFSSENAASAALRLILWSQEGCMIDLDGNQVPVTKRYKCDHCAFESRLPEATQRCPVCAAEVV